MLNRKKNFRKLCFITEKALPLQRVFHGIRFKVKKINCRETINFFCALNEKTDPPCCANQKNSLPLHSLTPQPHRRKRLSSRASAIPSATAKGQTQPLTSRCHNARADATRGATQPTTTRKDAGAVDRDGLENRCTLTGTQGSNPCLSADSN